MGSKEPRTPERYKQKTKQDLLQVIDETERELATFLYCDLEKIRARIPSMRMKLARAYQGVK